MNTIKKFIILVACFIILAVLFVVWRGYNRELHLDGTNINTIKISKGEGGPEVLITDPDEVQYIVETLNQITYTKPYLNNKNGYYFILNFMDKKGETMRGKEIIIRNLDNIQLSYFSYKIKNPEVIETLIEEKNNQLAL